MKFVNHKRGISTVIGGLLFVILLSAGLSVMSIALSSQISSTETYHDVSEKKIKKLKEDFDVRSTFSRNNVTVTVFDNGQNPVVAKSLWIIASGPDDFYSKRIELNPPVLVFDNQPVILPSQNIPYDSTNFDNVLVKVVSELGNIETDSFELPYCGFGACDSDSSPSPVPYFSLVSIPSIAKTSNDSTLLLSLHNPTDDPIDFRYRLTFTKTSCSQSNCTGAVFNTAHLSSSGNINVDQVNLPNLSHLGDSNYDNEFRDGSGNTLIDIIQEGYCQINNLDCSVTVSPYSSKIISYYFLSRTTAVDKFRIEALVSGNSLDLNPQRVTLCVYANNRDPAQCI